ncbi:hypothetical protein F3Y22_tig00111131pilonHSYRG00147 [Hibiscus syriacus]|uniref:Uncharacterized protein n=1 Tax=Hibiscus syriacus TaxID=106335 RepID=A0A6A2YY90_HIBSY|nr:hypothetical protein F3Y22_tig00111131pilonHSYRG00147 [Hibiscus syriacus]
MPTPAMWAVAPATTNGGNAFWMLPSKSGSAGFEILQQQRTGGHHLGLGVTETNMGLLGRTGISVYDDNNNRVGLKMNLDQENHTEGSDSGDENPATDS